MAKRPVYVAGAVARFAGAADDEAWLGLMNKLERTDEPAGAASEPWSNGR